MNLTPDLQREADAWKNTDEYNNALHSDFTRKVNDIDWLKQHRDWIEEHQFGFGDRPFHYLWKLLVNAMPPEFAFLEVGVFKGQVLSLVPLCARECDKTALCFGVTTLTNTEDVRCRYPSGPYAEWIKQIHDQFLVPQPELIIGKSTDPKVVQMVQVNTYHLVYIDAGHDYVDVCQDIENYALLTRLGGFLVMDDASIGRLNVGSCWPGLEDVARAVKEKLDPDPRFKFLFACGHINVFWRVKE